MGIKFHQYQSSYGQFRFLQKQYKLEPVSYKVFYDAHMNAALKQEREEYRTTYNQLYSEKLWYDKNRPYYNFHPRLIPIFSKSKLNFPAKYIEFPFTVMAIQFSENEPMLAVGDGKHWLRSCLVCRSNECFNTKTKEIENQHRLMIWMDFGENEFIGPFNKPFAIYTYRNIIWSGDETVDEVIDRLPIDPSYYEGLQVPEEKIMLCLKLAISIAFLAKDDSPIIVPHILNKDWNTFRTATPEKKKELHKKAIRERDSIGYLVGAEEFLDLGYIGPAQSNKDYNETNRTLNWSSITSGHWKVVRYGQNYEYGRVQWIMPYLRGEGKPFKPN